VHAKETCSRFSSIREYTAAPIYFQKDDIGGHEWLIEFETDPNSLSEFTRVLDKTLMDLNSDYETKRYKSLILKEPVVRELRKDTFKNWLISKNKLGGQSKIPRLSNDRRYVQEILKTAV